MDTREVKRRFELVLRGYEYLRINVNKIDFKGYVTPEIAFCDLCTTWSIPCVKCPIRNTCESGSMRRLHKFIAARSLHGVGIMAQIIHTSIRTDRDRFLTRGE